MKLRVIRLEVRQGTLGAYGRSTGALEEAEEERKKRGGGDEADIKPNKNLI